MKSISVDVFQDQPTEFYFTHTVKKKNLLLLWKLIISLLQQEALNSKKKKKKKVKFPPTLSIYAWKDMEK